jgi:hypothetical protein
LEEEWICLVVMKLVEVTTENNILGAFTGIHNTN